jgi:hypothetical protein
MGGYSALVVFAPKRTGTTEALGPPCRARRPINTLFPLVLVGLVEDGPIPWPGRPRQTGGPTALL